FGSTRGALALRVGAPSIAVGQLRMLTLASGEAATAGFVDIADQRVEVTKAIRMDTRHPEIRVGPRSIQTGRVAETVERPAHERTGRVRRLALCVDPRQVRLYVSQARSKMRVVRPQVCCDRERLLRL